MYFTDEAFDMQQHLNYGAYLSCIMPFWSSEFIFWTSL